MAVEKGLIRDINMGSVNKITKNGGGSSLLREPETAEAIVRAVKAVDVPVTVKLALLDRQGNQHSGLCQAHGGCGSADDYGTWTHPALQGYNGSASGSGLGVLGSSTIPVIANGDIFFPAAAVKCLEQMVLMCDVRGERWLSLLGRVDYFLKTGTAKPRRRSACKQRAPVRRSR